MLHLYSKHINGYPCFRCGPAEIEHPTGVAKAEYNRKQIPKLFLAGISGKTSPVFLREHATGFSAFGATIGITSFTLRHISINFFVPESFQVNRR